MTHKELSQQVISFSSRKSCHSLVNEVSVFEPSNDNPEEECVKCILHQILRLPKGDIRDACILHYRSGMMKLNCAKTKKSYMVTKEFFDKIDHDSLNTKYQNI